MKTKHWTEPNGILILKIPINWQYRNRILSSVEEKSPYSFEAYENSIGCFQISCYNLAKGFNPNYPIQKADSQLVWEESKIEDEKFEIHIWHAQSGDQLCMAKCIYEKSIRKKSKTKQYLKVVKQTLQSVRVIPKDDRERAIGLDKFDNFLGSLVTSFDITNKALENYSYIELVAITSNQIDAYLRISIVLMKQLNNNTNDIEVKYLFQGNEDKGIMERKIYKEALTLNIITNEIFEELNKLYDKRNRVIHRYIISYLKTVEITKLAVDYLDVAEKIRLILKKIEDDQMDRKIGIHGKGYSKNFEPTSDHRNLAYSMINDKHMLYELRKEIK